MQNTNNIDLILAIPMINALILTMKEAKEVESNTLDMENWVTVHNCGTSACVCGYQALSFNLECFPYARRDYVIGDLITQSDSISTDIDRVLGKNLGRSIWDILSFKREDYAIYSGLFTEDEIESINHLNCESGIESTFDDVIEYLELIKSKLV